MEVDEFASRVCESTATGTMAILGLVGSKRSYHLKFPLIPSPFSTPASDDMVPRRIRKIRSQ